MRAISELPKSVTAIVAEQLRRLPVRMKECNRMGADVHNEFILSKALGKYRKMTYIYIDTWPWPVLQLLERT